MSDAGNPVSRLLRRQLQVALEALRKAQRQIDALRAEKARRIVELENQVHALQQALDAKDPASDQGGPQARPKIGAPSSPPTTASAPPAGVAATAATGKSVPGNAGRGPGLAPPAGRYGRDPVVSVVIPVYNKEDFLEEGVASVLDNGFDTLEVVCVDDASTDDSAALLDQLARRESRLNFVPLAENAGASVARNTGIEAARGKYVFFLDADDRLTPGAIGELVARADANDSDLVRGKITGFTDSDEPHPLAGESFLHDRSADQVAWSDEESLWFYWYFTANLYRRSFLDEHVLRFPTGIRNEDPVFLCRCFLAARHIALADEVVYHYRIGTEQKRKTPSASFLRGWSFGYYAISDLLRHTGLPYQYFITHLPSVQAHCRSMAKQPERGDALRLLRPVSQMFSRYDLDFARDPSTQPWDRKRPFPPPLLEFYEHMATLPLETLCDWLAEE